MRIFDLVIVATEKDLDLLEARFREFEDTDTVHVICEAVAAYDGSPKPLHFLVQNQDGAWTAADRFAPWDGRWNHVKVEAGELPSDQDARTRKEHLREFLLHGITGEPGDIVLHGGIDEIPAAWVLPELGKMLLPVTLEMRLCAYRPGLVHPLPWRGTTVTRREDTGSLTRLRAERHGFPAVLNAGTRLAAMGEEPQATYDDGHRLGEQEIDASWPRYVHEGAHPGPWR